MYSSVQHLREYVMNFNSPLVEISIVK